MCHSINVTHVSGEDGHVILFIGAGCAGWALRAVMTLLACVFVCGILVGRFIQQGGARS